MGKLTVIGIIWLLLFAATLIVIDEQLSANKALQPSNGAQKPQDPEVPDTSGFVALHIDGCLIDDFWERGGNDLPVLNVALNYTVSNTGNISANIVIVEISVDSVYHSTETINQLMPNSEIVATAFFSVDYDQTRIVKIEASYKNLTNSWNYTIDAKLPRHPYWSMSKLFITPNEQNLQSTYEEIMSGVVFVHWITIRDWVGRSIEYTKDEDVYGVDEYWQLARETLESRRGDCEDLAILLCSLLRADGWNAQDVYVVIGQNKAGDYHAWVKIKIPLVGWYNIDPQLEGWYTLFGDFVSLHGYEAICNFNDQFFIEL
ncbi:MAG: transglutaminase domain-containing protein [Candidatus Bathyarchaeota archaeon]|nr:MAG: transglutaminase domain-containing protein [Candidatus Bathyarchaeota archaeon]